jgi:orotate phosphoribosyltransferase
VPAPGRRAKSDAAREQLLDLLVQHSYSRASHDKFELASGKRSNFYIDCKATTMRGEAMPLVGSVVAARLSLKADAVGGLTLGADAIAGATAFYCQTIGRHIDSFTVRKNAKQHGLMKYIEGCPGKNVVVLDDVVTTGGSTIDAIRQCRAANIHVVGVVALVDREEGGMDAVRAEAGAGVPVQAIFKKSELEARWQSLRGAAAPAGHRTAAD